MSKRHALLLTAMLGMAAPALAQTTSSTSTADPQLTAARVTFDVQRTGSDLASLLIAVAQSAGYEIIIEPAADAVLKANSVNAAGAAAGGQAGAVTTVNYKVSDKPFNEVWPLLLDMYGLSYETIKVGGKDILRVSVRPIQRVVKLNPPLIASQVEYQLKLAFGTPRAAAPATTAATGNAAPATTASAPEVVLDSPTMRIVAENSSNSIIIRGTNQEVAQVERLLSQIVAVQSPLVTQAAPTAAQPVQRVYTVKGLQADASALLAAQYPELKVTAVGQTGQLVITGPQATVDAALTLLAQVDRVAPAVVAATVVQRVFQLVNASAEEVKATLEGTLSRDLNAGSALTPNATLINPLTGQPYTSGTLANMPVSTAAAATGQGTATASAAPAGAQAATLIADKRTNTLIVRGTPEQVAQVAELVPQLDQKVPQVNVQVRIHEITERAARSLGVDWKIGFGGFSISMGGNGLQAAFDPTRNLVGFNIGPTLNALQSQGLSKSIYDGTITMQSGQRSLGGSTDTQNASATAAASIKSGGRLEINIPSQAANVPAIQKQIDYGVNLDFFSPQVAPDGTITMRVRGQVNDLRTPINADTVPNLLQFANSEAQTTLTFKNGETLLLAGLLANKETKTNAGTPLLSQLPIIGGLFGRESTVKEQTQLLVVITGNLVK
jgi:general secretion pathway protein D/type IV pilus assembly protein PilQ